MSIQKQKTGKMRGPTGDNLVMEWSLTGKNSQHPELVITFRLLSSDSRGGWSTDSR